MNPSVPSSHRPRRHGGMIGMLLVITGVLALFAVASIYARNAWRYSLPSLNPGDVSDVAVITPIELTVVDTESTERLRLQEGQNIPPIFAHDSQTPERVATSFLEKFDSMQIQFLRRLKTKWNLPLTDQEIETGEFREIVDAFQDSHSSFPLAATLARSWATEKVDDFRDQTVFQIRDFQRRYIVDNSPLPPTEDRDTVFWILPLRGDESAPSLATVRASAHSLPAKSIQTLKQTRSNLANELEKFPNEWSAFATGFLMPNLSFDSETTESSRREAVEALVVEKTYSRGDTIVSVGDVISPTQVAATRIISAHYKEVQMKNLKANFSLLGFGIAGVVAGAIVLLLFNSRNPKPIPQDLLRIESQDARTGFFAQMSSWLKQQFIARLIQQRNEALTNQEAASNQVEQMNHRLNKIQPDIRERINMYEKRIEDLEQELSESNEMNQELIRTRIFMAKKELEIEKAKSNISWN